MVVVVVVSAAVVVVVVRAPNICVVLEPVACGAAPPPLPHPRGGVPEQDHRPGGTRWRSGKPGHLVVTFFATKNVVCSVGSFFSGL